MRLSFIKDLYKFEKLQEAGKASLSMGIKQNRGITRKGGEAKAGDIVGISYADNIFKYNQSYYLSKLYTPGTVEKINNFWYEILGSSPQIFDDLNEVMGTVTNKKGKEITYRKAPNLALELEDIVGSAEGRAGRKHKRRQKVSLLPLSTFYLNVGFFMDEADIADALDNPVVIDVIAKAEFVSNNKEIEARVSEMVPDEAANEIYNFTIQKYPLPIFAKLRKYIQNMPLTDVNNANLTPEQVEVIVGRQTLYNTIKEELTKSLLNPSGAAHADLVNIALNMYYTTINALGGATLLPYYEINNSWGRSVINGRTAVPSVLTADSIELLNNLKTSLESTKLLHAHPVRDNSRKRLNREFALRRKEEQRRALGKEIASVLDKAKRKMFHNLVTSTPGMLDETKTQLIEDLNILDSLHTIDSLGFLVPAQKKELLLNLYIKVSKTIFPDKPATKQLFATALAPSIKKPFEELISAHEQARKNNDQLIQQINNTDLIKELFTKVYIKSKSEDGVVRNVPFVDFFFDTINNFDAASASLILKSSTVKSLSTEPAVRERFKFSYGRVKETDIDEHEATVSMVLPFTQKEFYTSFMQPLLIGLTKLDAPSAEIIKYNLSILNSDLVDIPKQVNDSIYSALDKLVEYKEQSKKLREDTIYGTLSSLIEGRGDASEPNAGAEDALEARKSDAFKAYTKIFDSKLPGGEKLSKSDIEHLEKVISSNSIVSLKYATRILKFEKVPSIIIASIARTRDTALEYESELTERDLKVPPVIKATIENTRRSVYYPPGAPQPQETPIDAETLRQSIQREVDAERKERLARYEQELGRDAIPVVSTGSILKKETIVNYIKIYILDYIINNQSTESKLEQYSSGKVSISPLFHPEVTNKQADKLIEALKQFNVDDSKLDTLKNSLTGIQQKIEALRKKKPSLSKAEQLRASVRTIQQQVQTVTDAEVRRLLDFVTGEKVKSTIESLTTDQKIRTKIQKELEAIAIAPSTEAEEAADKAGSGTEKKDRNKISLPGLSADKITRKLAAVQMYENLKWADYGIKQFLIALKEFINSHEDDFLAVLNRATRDPKALKSLVDDFTGVINSKVLPVLCFTFSTAQSAKAEELAAVVIESLLDQAAAGSITKSPVVTQPSDALAVPLREATQQLIDLAASIESFITTADFKLLSSKPGIEDIGLNGFVSSVVPVSSLPIYLFSTAASFHAFHYVIFSRIWEGLNKSVDFLFSNQDRILDVLIDEKYTADRNRVVTVLNTFIGQLNLDAHKILEYTNRLERELLSFENKNQIINIPTSSGVIEKSSFELNSKEDIIEFGTHLLDNLSLGYQNNVLIQAIKAGKDEVAQLFTNAMSIFLGYIDYVNKESLLRRYRLFVDAKDSEDFKKSEIEDSLFKQLSCYIDITNKASKPLNYMYSLISKALEDSQQAEAFALRAATMPNYSEADKAASDTTTTTDEQYVYSTAEQLGFVLVGVIEGKAAATKVMDTYAKKVESTTLVQAGVVTSPESGLSTVQIGNIVVAKINTIGTEHNPRITGVRTTSTTKKAVTFSQAVATVDSTYDIILNRVAYKYTNMIIPNLELLCTIFPTHTKILNDSRIVAENLAVLSNVFTTFRLGAEELKRSLTGRYNIATQTKIKELLEAIQGIDIETWKEYIPMFPAQKEKYQVQKDIAPLYAAFAYCIEQYPKEKVKDAFIDLVTNAIANELTRESFISSNTDSDTIFTKNAATPSTEFELDGVSNEEDTGPDTEIVTEAITPDTSGDKNKKKEGDKEDKEDKEDEIPFDWKFKNVTDGVVSYVSKNPVNFGINFAMDFTTGKIDAVLLRKQVANYFINRLAQTFVLTRLSEQVNSTVKSSFTNDMAIIRSSYMYLLFFTGLRLTPQTVSMSDFNKIKNLMG